MKTNHPPTNLQREKKVRRSIKFMADEGCSPESIVFAHGQIVTPDERDYLLEYEKKTNPPTETVSETLNRDERSLIMFFEDMAVNQFGWIDDPRKMNSVDLDIAKKWNESGFCLFKRASRDRRGEKQLTYIVKLSDEAWEIAHELRKARALRNIPSLFSEEVL